MLFVISMSVSVSDYDSVNLGSAADLAGAHDKEKAWTRLFIFAIFAGGAVVMSDHILGAISATLINDQQVWRK